MTHAEELADFAVGASFDRLSAVARDQIKIRVLDSLGCAIGALEGEPVRIIRQQAAEQPRIAQRFITALWFAIWTSTIAIWRNTKPAILATIWRQYLRRASMPGERAVT